jgi:hypothetical protein
VEAVFTKLSVGLKRLPATELGPLVYQLLKLLKVREYFVEDPDPGSIGSVFIKT